MKLAIQIDGHPAGSRAADTAYQFIKAALAKNHRIILVFFYYDGVFGGLSMPGDASEDIAAPPQWSELVKDYGIELVLCSAAAERRGLLGQLQHAREGRTAAMLSTGFRIGGLGQWVDACLRCDRMVRFCA